MNGTRLRQSGGFFACLLAALVVAALAVVACGGEPTPPSPPAASPSPALSYAEPPRPPKMALSTGTVGWRFKPTVDIEVTDLGCYDADQDGLALSHRVGIFDPRTKGLLASVTVRPESTLDGAFRWESLEAPVVLKAGRVYLVGTADWRRVERNNLSTCETLYGGHLNGEEQWAPEIAFRGLRMSSDYSARAVLRSTGHSLPFRFTAPTGRNPYAVAYVQFGGMSPNFKFVPVSDSSPTP